MMLSVKMALPASIKTEPEEEVTPEDTSRVPELSAEDFDLCAACKGPFRRRSSQKENAAGSGETMSNGQDTESGGRRGQQSSSEETMLGEGRKVKEFYSFNTVTGELLHVTALQALLSIYELRLLKCAPGLDLQEMNENIGFCQGCGTLVSQLYKLHQEVSGLMQSGSVMQKLVEYEDLLTDNHETDFNAPKRKHNNQQKLKKPAKVNGISVMDDGIEQDDNGADDDWHPDVGSSETAWNNNDDDQDQDMDTNNDDTPMYDSNDNDDNTNEEVNIKPIISKAKSVGIKITSVGSAPETLFCEDLSDSDSSGSRSRRSTARKVDYAKVLEGPKIDGIEDDNPTDEDWKREREKSHRSHHRKGGRQSTKDTARKKTSGSSSHSPSSESKRGRGRPPKSAALKVVIPPPTKKRESDGTFKLPAEKISREATCQICRKVFPSSYLAEHMNVAHNAVQGQPCLICGKFFDSSYKAIKHLLTHVPEKAFGCSRCHSTFKTADERNLHLNSHPDFDQKLMCPKCPQGFTSLLLLHKHEAQKHRTTKSFLCSICAKLLTGKDEWIQHILSHGPFQCYYCREFLRPGEYKRHVQSVHIGNRPRPSTSSTGPIAEVTLD